ncbi:HAD-IC family P-type ATPase [Aggregatilinea lenta]|uniref:HAD-IC family P-type ATPase n=1 Tax=Aggregatilinea lenta TaxID=913108 RepID=UPI000E5BE93F|nr:HAD-IC family P-type ATPase [Aggregatilinea lenta]
MSDPASTTTQAPPAIRGLTGAEVQERLRQGQRNVMPVKTSRTLPQIFSENFFSLTNVILFGIMIVLVIIGEPGDAFVTGGVVLINVVIGVFQELRAKRQLDRIALLTRPRVVVIRDGQEHQIDPGDVVLGDALVLHPGDQIVVDGKLLTARRIDVNESLLTGESDFVPKAQGDELLSGSFCVTGSGIYSAERVGADSFANKLTAGAREYRRVQTPLQHQISILVRALVTLAILLSILLFLSYAVKDEPFRNGVESAAVVISLVPQGLLLMITVAYALGAVRIAGRGALVQQINAVESLSNVDVLCLDKTGTLTTNRIALREIIPIHCTEADLRHLLGDFAASTGRVNRTAEAIADACPGMARPIAAEVPFSSEYKWSGATLGADGLQDTLILGAPEVLLHYVTDGTVLASQIEAWADEGLRVLLFTRAAAPLDGAARQGPPALPADLDPLGWLTFSDELRPDVQSVLDQFREAGVALKLISGDNPQTVAALAGMAGFSRDVSVVSGLDLAEMTEGQFTETINEATVFGRITPEQKQRIVQALRADGHYVAMIGDGVNDVLSLKHAQMGIAMESGSQATRSVADMVLLGDRFGVLPEAIKEGQRILNGMQDVMRLFLTRTIYAALLIIVAGFIGATFPFTPRHNALLTTLPVGIPAVILTVWASSGQTDKRNLLAVVGEFALPAGFSIALTTLAVFLLYRDHSVEMQRTVLTTTALFCGLWLIILAEHPVEVWKSGRPHAHSPRRRWLALAMLSAYGVVYAIPPLRDFFELSVMGWQDYAVAIAAVAIWAIVVQLLWRFDVFKRVLIPGE